jgi:hypothetical protein
MGNDRMRVLALLYRVVTNEKLGVSASLRKTVRTIVMTDLELNLNVDRLGHYPRFAPSTT